VIHACEIRPRRPFQSVEGQLPWDRPYIVTPQGAGAAEILSFAGRNQDQPRTLSLLRFLAGRAQLAQSCSIANLKLSDLVTRALLCPGMALCGTAAGGL